MALLSTILVAFMLGYCGAGLPGKFQRIACYAFGVLYVIGILFKIMHWPGAKISIYTSLVGVFVLYGMHFINKTHRTLQDYLLISWLITIAAYWLFMEDIRPFHSYLALLQTALLWVNIAYALFINLKDESHA